MRGIEGAGEAEGQRDGMWRGCRAWQNTQVNLLPRSRPPMAAASQHFSQSKTKDWQGLHQARCGSRIHGATRINNNLLRDACSSLPYHCENHPAMPTASASNMYA
jgi:hypothetical protein